eukprot:462645-Hanusia_phi.AAC.1
MNPSISRAISSAERSLPALLSSRLLSLERTSSYYWQSRLGPPTPGPRSFKPEPGTQPQRSRPGRAPTPVIRPVTVTVTVRYGPMIRPAGPCAPRTVSGRATRRAAPGCDDECAHSPITVAVGQSRTAGPGYCLRPGRGRTP